MSLLEKQAGAGPVGFFEKLGIKGGKSLVLLGVLYAACWFIIIIGNVFADGVIIGGIPAPLVYATAAFPFVFFSLAFLVLGLNSFFSLMFRKLSFPLFALFCLALWLVWTYGNTLVALYLTTGLWDGWGRLIPITLMLMAAGYAGFHVRINYRYENGRGFQYDLMHWLLFALSAVGGSFYGYFNFDALFGPGTVAAVFGIFTIMQLFIFSALYAAPFGGIIYRNGAYDPPEKEAE